MTISETLLSEFDQEMALTRKMLECVPEDKFTWKPHEKSFTLGRLVNHLAAMPAWPAVVIYGMGKKPSEAASKTELLETIDRNVALGRKVIAEPGMYGPSADERQG